MDRNALAELLQALESRRDAEERRREERYTALIERTDRKACVLLWEERVLPNNTNCRACAPFVLLSSSSLTALPRNRKRASGGYVVPWLKKLVCNQEVPGSNPSSAVLSKSNVFMHRLSASVSSQCSPVQIHPFDYVYMPERKPSDPRRPDSLRASLLHAERGGCETQGGLTPSELLSYMQRGEAVRPKERGEAVRPKEVSPSELLSYMQREEAVRPKEA
ncbi:UNVERIFIED_CONTAM: hypothetical protein FKN15_009359 [Acipenser sinensis]